MKEEKKVKSVECLKCGAKLIPSEIAYHHTMKHKGQGKMEYRIIETLD